MRNKNRFYTPALAVAAAISLTFSVAHAGLSVRGVRNFQTVNDRVYRGAQPSGEGFRELSAAGVKTILDLREDDDRAKDEKRLVKALGMRYVNVPMKGMTTPTDRQISKALKVLNDEGAAPVFVHCKRGADRTGVVVACYRIQHDGWDREEALREARSYGMSWYQFPLIGYIGDYEPKNGSVRDAAGDAADSVRDGAGNAVDALRDLSRRAAEIFR